MLYKKLTYWSIVFVVLIFVSQAFLIWKLFLLNKEFLARETSQVLQEAYSTDMNKRFRAISSLEHPGFEMGKIPRERKRLGANDRRYKVDEMSGVDATSTTTVLNIAVETFVSELNPIKLSAIDSLCLSLLKRDRVEVELYSQVINPKTERVLESTFKGKVKPIASFFQIKSKGIPLNFQQTKMLEVVLVNPFRAVFSLMAGILFFSFLFSLFCIYCLYILQRTLARQKKLAQSKNDFFSQVSHELKRPVSVVYKAIDSLLNLRVAENKDRRDKYLRISMEELQRMNGQIDMILTMSMMEEGVFQLNQTTFSLHEMILELNEHFLLGVTKPVEMKVDDRLEHSVIRADRSHLYQCVSNLLDNAVKYSGDSVQIEMELFEQDGYTAISVRDNGFGIASDDSDKIFQKFERANAGKKAPGFGIGLSYVKQMVEMHHGFVRMSSEVGKGSQFILQIPV